MKQVEYSKSSLVKLNGDVVINQEDRAFEYILNEKRAKAKLLKGAKRAQNLKIEVSRGCVNMRFDNGSYFEIVLPLLREWSKKCGENVKLGLEEMKIIEVEAGYEKSTKHVDTKLVVMVNNNRFVLHAYNGTQNLMVQDKNYENFATTYLEPFFIDKIEAARDTITKINNVVKDALSKSKPLKGRTDKTFTCPQCEKKTSSNNDLKVHIKSCHTKPGIESPKKKILRASNVSIEEDINDGELLMIEMDEFNSQSVVLEDLITCEICEAEADSQSELRKHMQISHGWNCSQVIQEPVTIASNDNESPCESLQIVEDVQKSNQYKITCESCQVIYDDKHECLIHTENHLNNSTHLCDYCGLEFLSQRDLECHVETTHDTLMVQPIEEATSGVNCGSCEFEAEKTKDLKAHKQLEHMNVKIDVGETLDKQEIECDQCDYKCKLNIQLRVHKRKLHIMDPKYKCKSCEFTSNFAASIWEHMVFKHPELSHQFYPKENENIALKIVAEQNTEILEEMEQLRKDSFGAFEQIGDTLANTLKANKDENDDRFKTLAEAVTILLKKVSKLEKVAQAVSHKKIVQKVAKSVEATRQLQPSHTTTHKVITKSRQNDMRASEAPIITNKQPNTKSTSNISKEKPKTVPNIPQVEKDTSTTRSEVKSSFNLKPKLLYVADSVGHTASLRDLEKSCNARIVSARAYSSMPDASARWPDQSYKDVVEEKLKNPGRENFDILVMSAPTVDISNLDTSRLRLQDNTDFYKQRVIQSSRNMFNLAKASLEQNANLRKVIIMEHPPRFDSRDIDPTSLKPSLRALANATLYQLMDNCSSKKEKIFIGSHSLECASIGATYQSRYVDQHTGKYDGVHLHGQAGRRDYTDSVKTIFMLGLPENTHSTWNTNTNQDYHKSCPQALYQRRYNQTINLKNRFSVFNSNQGNY